MTSASIQVMRDGLPLPVPLTPAEAHELLTAGFLRPDDLWRPDEAGRWRPLTELRAPEHPGPGWLSRAKAAAAQFSRNLAAGTEAAQRQVRSLVGNARQTFGEAQETLLLDYGDAIRNRVKAIAASETAGKVRMAARDEIFLTKVFGAAYDCLPKPVCRFVTEAQFVEFCVRHQRRLLDPPTPDGPTVNPAATPPEPSSPTSS